VSIEPNLRWSITLDEGRYLFRAQERSPGILTSALAQQRAYVRTRPLRTSCAPCSIAKTGGDAKLCNEDMSRYPYCLLVSALIFAS
jgi:hypothetical protein